MQAINKIVDWQERVTGDGGAHGNCMPIRTHQELPAFLVFGGVPASLLLWLSGSLAQDAPTKILPTFYRDVLPILEQHCQSCHRAGGIAPMPFETQEKSMPPWFADSHVGQFSNDPSLRPEEIGALAAWAEAKSPAGETGRHGAGRKAGASPMWICC